MVRDAALPSSRWIRLVMNNAANESDVGVLQRLLSRSLSAAERYGDPSRRDALLQEMAAHARTEVEAAEPGSDAQLAWARHWASCSRSGQHRDDVRALLDGELAFEGLAVDTDLRWHLVTCLAHSGMADDALIDAELERDNTDVGARAALAARAARPTPEDKAAAWEALLDDSQSHAVAREVAQSCFRLDQAEVLEPYSQQYLDVVTAIWERRSVSAGIDFAEQVFPHPAASEELLADIRSHLEGDVPAPLRRVLLEQCDILERTLRARALDAAQVD
jgi:aminopeptidase N